MSTFSVKELYGTAEGRWLAAIENNGFLIDTDLVVGIEFLRGLTDVDGLESDRVRSSIIELMGVWYIESVAQISCDHPASYMDNYPADDPVTISREAAAYGTALEDPYCGHHLLRACIGDRWKSDLLVPWFHCMYIHGHSIEDL